MTTKTNAPAETVPPTGSLPSAVGELLDEDGKPRRSTERLSWRRLKPFLAASPRRMVALSFSSAMGGFAEAAVLVLLVQIALAISGDENFVDASIGPFGTIEGVSLSALFWAAAGLSVLRMVLQAWNAHLSARMGAEVLSRLRKETYEAYTRAGWSQKSLEQDGHLQDLMTTHIGRSANAVIVVSVGLGALFSFLSLMVSALLVNPAATVTIIVTVTVLFFLLRPLSKWGRRYSTEQAKVNMAYAGAVSESVFSAQEIEVFNAGPAMIQRVRRLADEFAHWWYRSQFIHRLLPQLYQSIAMLLILGGLAALHALDDVRLTSLGAVVVMLVRALSYSSTLQTQHHKLHEMAPFMDVVRQAGELYRRSAVPPGGQPVPAIERISFDHVSFDYVPGVRVLDDVCFEVGHGEAIGIIGPSGAGKSTMVQILLRLRTPTEGRVLVNGRDCEDLDRHDWFRRVALVAQDNRLISGTVRDNIRFFRDHVTDDDIERAARMAQIHDDIVSWTDGYDTEAGGRASAVSGGQRQRICLARALAGHPDVVVLDEPTSALDMRSEALVHEALETVKGETTLFIVAHRLSTLNVCDRIMVFGDGRLQAFDSRVSLEAGNPFYRQAVELSKLH